MGRDNTDVRRAAYAALTDIARIPTHLFMFIDRCQNYINDRIKRNPATQPEHVSRKQRRKRLARENDEQIEEDAGGDEEMCIEVSETDQQIEVERQAVES